MLDSHCHLDFKDFDGQRDKIINDALSSGVHTMINIGADLFTSRNSVKLAEKYDCIYAAVGVHPHDARTYNDSVEKELHQLLAHKKVVAVGEIGLDYYRNLSPHNVQKQVFRRQISIAVERNLPVVIHSRESFDDTVNIVMEFDGRHSGGIFHCFPGSTDDAKKVIDMGFYVGMGGRVTYPKSGMAAVAAEVPLNSILLETDCPYLTPVPFRGKRNQPAYIKYIRDKIAELRGIAPQEVEKVTDRNSQKVYGLVETFGG